MHAGFRGAGTHWEVSKEPMSTTHLELSKNWFILSSLVSRDFKLKYRRSILGVAWSVLNPLLMMIVMTFVFSHVFRFNTPGMNYPGYLILGQIIFTFMVGSTTSGLNSIVGAASLIKKVRIEKAVFPLESVVSELVNLAFSFVAVALVLIFTRVSPAWSWFMMPVLLIYLMLFCLGISLALAALEVFFRDVNHLWGVFTLMWMYATPVFYPMTILPDIGQRLMHYNPMFQLINYLRVAVLEGTFPDLKTNLICLGSGLLSVAIGLLIFRKTERKFILYV